MLLRDGDQPIVTAYDRNGTLRFKTNLSIPGVDRLLVRDLAASANSTVAAAVSAMNSAGQVAAAIVWIDPAGRILKVVRTSPFGSYHIAFTSDGHLWAVGRVYDSRFEEVSSYDVVRQYDANGDSVRTALPRTTFAIKRPPASSSFLIASPDRVGFYSIAAAEFIELSLSGDVIGRWPLAPLPVDIRITGAALTTTNDVFLSAQRLQTVANSPQSALPNRLLYRLDVLSGALIPVTIPAATKTGVLIGSDDENLVFGSSSGVSWFLVK
ncbi:MAG: hypothetical protein ACRD4P_05300 [Bryobacteraceae bacterium]